jgi:hypothetical protein
MQIPFANPMASYPQPYATWVELRTDAARQRDAATVNGPGESPAPQLTTPGYAVDAIA